MATKKTHRWGLKRDIAERWLKALDDGEFKKVCGNWETNVVGEHCVLGVLGKVNGAKIGQCNRMEHTVLKISLTSCDPNITKSTAVEDFRTTVMQMNDSGKSFKTLAKYIRDNVKLVDDVS